MDWLVWRPVLAERIPDGLAEVRGRWTLADLLEAHLALDALDTIEAVERERRERDRAVASARGRRR